MGDFGVKLENKLQKEKAVRSCVSNLYHLWCRLFNIASFAVSLQKMFKFAILNTDAKADYQSCKEKGDSKWVNGQIAIRQSRVGTLVVKSLRPNTMHGIMQQTPVILNGAMTRKTASVSVKPTSPVSGLKAFGTRSSVPKSDNRQRWG